MTYQRLVGNRNIEDAAIDWVMELERRAGRAPTDRRSVSTYPGDIESPPLVIEVKAVAGSARGFWIPLEESQYRAATKPSSGFALYVVENIGQGDPAKFAVRIFAGDKLAALVSRAKPRTYFEVPLAVGDHDAAPSHETLDAGSCRRSIDPIGSTSSGRLESAGCRSQWGTEHSRSSTYESPSPVGPGRP